MHFGTMAKNAFLCTLKALAILCIASAWVY